MAANAYSVPDFIDPGLYQRMRLPADAVSVAGRVKEILLESAEMLNRGHHMCSLAVKEPFKTSLALCSALCSPADEALLRECSILVRPPNSASEAIDNDALAARLMRITIKHDNGEPSDDEEETIKRFYVRLRHQYGIRDVSRSWKAVWKANRLTYDASNNGKFPIRDFQGGPLKIQKIFADDANGEGLSSDLLGPFIDAGRTEAQRAALYARLTCVPFTRAFMKHEREETMLGQSTVLAVKALTPGECLGIYGGTFIPADDLSKSSALVDFSYMLSTSPKGFSRQTSVDGDNIIAKINTIVEYDILSGVPGKQARVGYNVKFVPFQIELDDGSTTHIGAAFVTEPVTAGEELRINYNYTNDVVKKTFG